jgi:hypothetical protein
MNTFSTGQFPQILVLLGVLIIIQLLLWNAIDSTIRSILFLEMENRVVGPLIHRPTYVLSLLFYKEPDPNNRLM